MDNFFRRTITGAAIVIIILGGFWLHPVSFFITGLILVAGIQYEYYVIISNSGVNPRKAAGIITGIATYTLSTMAAAGLIKGEWLLLVIPLVFVLIISELYRKEPEPFNTLAHTLFPLIYGVLPFALFPFSAFSHSGLESIISHGDLIFSPGIVIGFFLLVWANDTGAYLTGMTLGKHKLFERISPKKTWEGFSGGFIIAIAAAWFLSGWLGVVSRVEWIVIAVIVSVVGTYGDLVESMLKRSTGVKDSGNILPGHGGFLDRFDSTIIAFPVVYLFFSLFA
ncbi:MAG TPA: phosphatidate cytidylyltransferase [Bacteroidales bacterium]|nr:phosphatidate cytidylyltransferase [Bacteroidales bacterium]